MKLRRLLFLVLLLPAIANAEVNGSYFAVIVDDVVESSSWYQSVLQLQEVSRLTEPGRYDIVNLRGPGIFVELLQLDAAVQRPEGLIEGPFKVGFLVTDLAVFVDELPDGLERPAIVSDEKNRLLLIQLRDPDNYIVQVMQINSEE